MGTQGEYECQYTNDQIRKKHKSWHDGKLKVRKDGKIALHNEDGSTLSIRREAGKWLDPDRFNQEFQFCSRYVVIIASQYEQPSLAMSMKPFRRPRIVRTTNITLERPARRNNVVVQQPTAATRRTTGRIRHVEARPIRI